MDPLPMAHHKISSLKTDCHSNPMILAAYVFSCFEDVHVAYDSTDMLPTVHQFRW